MKRSTPEEQVVQILKSNNISMAATLPCDRIKRLLPLIDDNFRTVKLTREENAVGICGGYYLGGGRSVMIIQSTGLGNMLNALMSFNMVYSIPLPIIASWRGIYKETIPAQVPLGHALPGILEACGIKYSIVGSSVELNRLNYVISDSYENLQPHVALVLPSVWEKSRCAPPPKPREIVPRTSAVELKTELNAPPAMTRYQAIEALVSILGDNDVVICNLGLPSKELYHIQNRSLNFYMLGSMGQASAIGLGLAMVQDRRVVVIDGDGSLLMNPNVLTQIAAQSPPNLVIFAVDNGVYGSTGNQETLACRSIDLELMARGHGIKYTSKAQTKEEIIRVYQSLAGEGGPALIDVIATPVNEPVDDIRMSPVEIKKRFMSAISG